MTSSPWEGSSDRKSMQKTLGCVMCKQKKETTSHMFFTCEVSQKVWNLCERWVGISSSNHNHRVTNFQNFNSLQLNTKQNIAWKSVWLSIVWDICNYNNKAMSRQRKIDVKVIWYRINFKHGYGWNIKY